MSPAPPDPNRPQRDPRCATVVVTGATGNIGTALLRRLGADEGVGEIRAVARRMARPDHPYSRQKAVVEHLLDGVEARHALTGEPA